MDHTAELYACYLAGDDKALVEIIQTYKDGLILFLNRYVNNIHDAEELAEETFFKLVIRKPKFKGGSSFKTWLYTIGRNTALDHLRKFGRITETSEFELARLCRDEDELERTYLREERKIAVHRALSNLDPERSRVLYLKYFEEMSSEEIARVLKKNKRQVSNLLYQAKKALKTQLEQEGITDDGF